MWQLSKFLWCVSAMVFLLPAPAMAGDRAIVNVYGYSPDGRYFAFEEFGIQGGSGFAYTSIYMIDLVEDQWVIGTPVRLQAEDEKTPLITVRRKAQAMALSRLDDLQINYPPEALALIGAGAVDMDGFSLDFGIPPINELEMPDERFELKLTEFKTKGAAPCQDWFDEEPMGFALNLTIRGKTQEVYSDAVLPRSRGCPMAYRIKAVVIPFNDRDLTHAVVMVSLLAHGFEGPDRRFLAIPIGRSIKE